MVPRRQRRTCKRLPGFDLSRIFALTLIYLQRSTLIHLRDRMQPQIAIVHPDTLGASECACEAGFHGTTQDDCQMCPAGSYCTGNNSIATCPQYSESNSGSTSAADCTCKAGYFEPSKPKNSNIPPICVLCPADTYCPGGQSNLQCVQNAQ
eukprot:757944-Hanusia_phi.AAC.7